MTILIMFVIGIVATIIGYVWGAINNTDPRPECCLHCLHEHKHPYPSFCINHGVCCDHYGVATTRAENSALRNENYRLQREVNNMRRTLSDYRNLPIEKVWFTDVGDKERVATKLKEALKPLEELKKELL